MSTVDNVVPYSPAPVMPHPVGPNDFKPGPGLSLKAISALEVSYPGMLTEETRAFLQKTCGFTAGEIGMVDFTGRCHPSEPLNVFRPCITLALHEKGYRWIAETSRERGLPGPVWCVLSDPAVAIYVSDDVGAFLTAIEEARDCGRLSRWFDDLRGQARAVWTCSRTLARVSHRTCREDLALRGWLAELPPDAHVYDLRKRSAVRGWPYGVAGPEGRLYRCGRLPVFAVSATTSASRWRQHLTQIAATSEILSPAIARSAALV